MSLKNYFGRLFSSASNEPTIAQRNEALLAAMVSKPKASKKAEEDEVDLSIFSPKELEVAAAAYQNAKEAELNAQILAAHKADLEKRQQALKALRERQAKAVRQLDYINQGVEAALVKVTAERISLKRDNEHQGDLLLALKEEQGKWTDEYLEAKALELLDGQTSTPPAPPKPTAPPTKTLAEKLAALGLDKNQVSYILNTDLAKLKSDLKAAGPKQRMRIQEHATLIRPLACKHAEISHWKEVGSILQRIAKEEAEAKAAAAASAEPPTVVAATDSTGSAPGVNVSERVGKSADDLTVTPPSNKTPQGVTSSN